jgi:lipopolysaccharide transport system ATP-binding protein
VKDENGQVLESFDIRKPIGIEMVYEVLKPGHLLLPHHNLFNEDGLHIFTTIDCDQKWRGRHRLPGIYISTAWIPGNFLSEGIITVNSVIFSLEPQVKQFSERDVVSFQVIDSMDGSSARGDWSQSMKGAVRPLLEWDNLYRKFE